MTVRYRLKTILTTTTFVLLIFVTRFVLRRNSWPSTPTTNPEPYYPPIKVPEYVHWTAQPCRTRTPPLLAIIHSTPSHVQHRKAIRQTWGSTNLTRTLFVVGRSSIDQIDRKVEREAETWGDMICLDLEDTYENLTLKHLAAIRWVVQNCPVVDFVLKADDDAFVDVRRILKVLEPALKVSQDLLACRIVPDGTVPQRSGKYKVSLEQFPENENYPEYCSGLAYFCRPITLAKIYNAALSRKLRFLSIDDVFVTGMAATAAKVRRLDLGVWFARTESEVIRWLRDTRMTHALPWIVAEMTARHWPLDAQALWKKSQRLEARHRKERK